MTGVDWLIVGIVVLLALFGYAQGFVAGALALLGFAAGAWLGTRIAPLLLHDGRHSPWAPAFALIGALVAGAVFALGLEGVGAKLRAQVRSPAATAVDGLLGAALTACVGLGIAWVLGALALANGGEARREVQRSAILRQINAVLPPTSGLIDALQRLDPFPRIKGPSARVPAPTEGIARAAGVAGVDDLLDVVAPQQLRDDAHLLARPLVAHDEPELVGHDRQIGHAPLLVLGVVLVRLGELHEVADRPRHDVRVGLEVAVVLGERAR